MPKAVLCVGMCVLDIIHVCSEYPVEDSDKRSKHGRWQRGGNASNNCTVLSQLGMNAHFLGPLSRSKMFEFVLEDMRERNIRYDNCPFHECEVPLSSVLLNEQTGSRTIVHSNPDTPILRAVDFDEVDLSQYAWVHFEGRDPEETAQMINRIHQWNEARPNEPKIRISLDMEKTRFDYDLLVRLIDVAFLGKDLAMHWGWMDKSEAIERFVSKFANCHCTVICPWGDTGVAARNSDGAHFTAPIYRAHAVVVDSLGAGDTFAAAVIYALLMNFSDVGAAIEFGCRIAGDKVGYFGYDCVAHMHEKIQNKLI